MPPGAGPTHPPLDFACFEQYDSDVVERWVEFMEGVDGSPIWSITLGAVRAGAPAPVFVKTMPRDRFHELIVGESDLSDDFEAAYDAVRAVVNCSMALTLDLDSISSLTFERVQTHLTDFMKEQASSYTAWETTEIRIDDIVTTCSEWEFAGWRCAVTFSPVDRYAIVYGPLNCGMPDSLISRRNLAGYGLQPHQPIDFYDVMADHPGLDRWRPPDAPEPRFLHSDFYQVVRDLYA